PKELGAGVLDLKNFYVESPDLVARRIRRLLESVKAERLWINPDCGLARLPRHLAFAKLQAPVAGAHQVRNGLVGAPSISNRPPAVQCDHDLRSTPHELREMQRYKPELEAQ